MFVTRVLARLTIFAGLMALPSTIPTAAYAQQAVAVGATDIGGIVVGAAGPEAGVWVIAETTELPTLGEEVAIGMLRDERTTLREPFDGFSFTRFDGSRVTI